MMTRLMYGGRVSLVIGFIVVFIAAFLGIVLVVFPVTSVVGWTT